MATQSSIANEEMISVFGSSLGEEETAEVSASIRSQWIGAGPKVETFERAFAERLHLPDFAMTNSGSNSLYLAVRILDLPPGSEVILPSFTWIACAQAVLLNGCRPVFCDVDPHTHNVTAATIAARITPKTAAVMVVHYAGKPVDMEPILALGYPVIEDAAHAVDSEYMGTACGAIADVGIYSFDAVKNLACPEGGGITARDPARMARARALRYCGIAKSGFSASSNAGRWWEYPIQGIAPKMIANDVCAGIALAQLRKLDQHQRRRGEIWNIYRRELGGFAWLTLPVDAAPDERHSFFTYCVRVAGKSNRDCLAKYLYERRIYTTLRYHPLHLNPIYDSGYTLPVSEDLSEDALNLPLHPRLSDADLERIIQALHTFPIGPQMG